MVAKVFVRQAGKKGRGVFAINKIKSGSVIETAPYLPLSKRDHRNAQKTDLIRFIYDAGHGQAAVGLGFASLYNHSETPNATYIVNVKNRTIKITATSEIPTGEEVTIDYGYHPGKPETWPDDYASYMRSTKKRAPKNRAKSALSLD